MMIEPRVHEIHSDGITVWVNDEGGLLGRFGRQGIDVHRPMSEQAENGECLHCTHGPTRVEDWSVFQAKMREHFGIDVPDSYIPIRFRR